MQRNLKWRIKIRIKPEKSVNCQVEEVVIYVSLSKKRLLRSALENKESFKYSLWKNVKIV